MLFFVPLVGVLFESMGRAFLTASMSHPILIYLVFVQMSLSHLMRQNNRNNNGLRANGVVVGEGMS